MTLPPVPRPPTESIDAPADPGATPAPRPGRGLVVALVSTAFLATLLAAGLVAVSVVATTQDDGTDLTALEEQLDELSGSFGPFPDDEDWYEYEEELYGDGEAYYVEDEDVADATEDACEDLQSTAADLPLLSSADPVPPLTAVRDAVAAIVAGLETIEDLDSDSDEWRGDVVLLQEQLDEALASLGSGGPAELDFSAGDDIGMRMYWGSPVGCEPPLQLLALDPDYSVYGDTYSYAS